MAYDFDTLSAKRGARFIPQNDGTKRAEVAGVVTKCPNTEEWTRVAGFGETIQAAKNHYDQVVAMLVEAKNIYYRPSSTASVRPL